MVRGRYRAVEEMRNERNRRRRNEEEEKSKGYYTISMHNMYKSI